jgi:hypothetical protein
MNPDDPARLARLERQVAFLLRHAGIDPDLAAGEVAGASTFGSPSDIFSSAAASTAAVGAGVPAGAVPESSQYPPALTAALERGNKIEAIKLYRELTGVSLREAKAAVDAMGRGGR